MEGSYDAEVGNKYEGGMEVRKKKGERIKYE